MKIRSIKILGASLVGAGVIFVGGIVAWGGFNTAMEATNTTDFCISCHEMFDNVYQEYRETVHYQNRTGVRASCSDCHVPDPWVYKVVRKVQATNELYHWALGTIDTKEKFEAKRLTMAKHVWKAMKETDSRECRNCHSWEGMMQEKQKRRAWKQHELAQSEGQTCIDCHKGIAHRAVHVLLEDDEDPYDGLADSRSLPVEVASAEPEPAPAEAEVAEAEPAEAEETETAPAEEAAPMASESEAPESEVAAAPDPAASESETPESDAPESAESEDSAEPAESATQVAAATGGVDWASVEGRAITLFYPGQSSMEWVLKGSDHGGARAITKIGDRCAECHEGEQSDMGQRIVTGEKLEPQVIPGKRASIEVQAKAAHKDGKLYFNFTWPKAEHTPVPFVDGGKMDPENETKLAVMLIPESNEFAAQVGCWATCHHDSRYMPDHPDMAAIDSAGDLKQRLAADEGVTKYLRESRSEIEIRGTDGKPRGGWDKLLPDDQLAPLMSGEQFIDLLRFKSGSGAVENGHVLERRVAEGGQVVEGSGGLEGDTWSVTLAVALGSSEPGDLNLDPGKNYMVGVAIHDDFTAARFHHVSIEYLLGFDNPEAEINAVGQ